jgi:hypothetical protein
MKAIDNTQKERHFESIRIESKDVMRRRWDNRPNPSQRDSTGSKQGPQVMPQKQRCIAIFIENSGMNDATNQRDGSTHRLNHVEQDVHRALIPEKLEATALTTTIWNIAISSIILPKQ